MYLSTAKGWRLVDVHQGVAKWPSTTLCISLASRYSMNHPLEPHHRINIISLPKTPLPTNTHILSCLPEYRLPASRPWRRPRCSSLSRLAAYSSSTRSSLPLSHVCVRAKKQTACSTLATSTWNTTRKELARVASCSPRRVPSTDWYEFAYLSRMNAANILTRPLATRVFLASSHKHRSMAGRE